MSSGSAVLLNINNSLLYPKEEAWISAWKWATSEWKGNAPAGNYGLLARCQYASGRSCDWPTRSSSPAVALGPTANGELAAGTRIRRPTASFWCNPCNADFEISVQTQSSRCCQNLLITQPTEYKIKNSNINESSQNSQLLSSPVYSNGPSLSTTTPLPDPVVCLQFTFTRKTRRHSCKFSAPLSRNVKMWLRYFCSLHGARFIDFWIQ